MKKTLLTLILFISLSSIAIAAFKHQLIASTLIKHSEFIQIDKDVFVSPDTSKVQQRELIELLQKAKARIINKFGSYTVSPIIIFSNDNKQLKTYSNNNYGNTDFTLNTAYIVVGENGKNIDVVSHELVHAELFHRIGYVNRWLQIPVWFDEGIAMQVDLRAKYANPTNTTTDIKKLKSVNEFYSGDISEHYSLAKFEIKNWLKEHGDEAFYKLLDEIKTGSSFQEAY